MTTISGPFVMNAQDGLVLTSATVTTLRATNFGLDLTPIARQSTISDPAGGATVDAEARAAIATIIDRLQAFGFIS